MGCERLQGFYLSHPLAPGAALALLTVTEPDTDPLWRQRTAVSIPPQGSRVPDNGPS